MTLRNFLTVGTLSMALAACSGGGDSTETSSSPSPEPAGTPSSIKGVVAMGLPLVNATVKVTDSTGKLCLATAVHTDEKGYYEADTSKCVPPMVVQASGVTAESHGGVRYTWESISISNNEVINITPLTMAISSSAAGGIPTTIWQNLNLRSTPAQLAQKLKDAQTALITAMRASNINVPADFDLVHSPFAADGTGIDAIMDGIKVVQDSTTGDITVQDKTGTVNLFTIKASTGTITSDAAGAALWPDYYVFNSLSSGTPRELGTNTAAIADDTAIYSPATSSTGKLTFTKASHSQITVTGNYDRTDGGISPLSGQSGNERMDAQIVAICTGGNAYVMLNKAATIVPLSELINGAAMNMEGLGVSEGCPLTGSADGPTSFQFSGKGGSITTPDGVITADQFMAVNSSTINGAAGYDRFLAFKVSVGGKVRYGLIERGLDEGDGQTPFMYVHVQKN
ncbi:MAG: hypothetical protein JWQ23_1463 [Herminiimonas sp.]|nr:hypothetical protein [Herminiimonas sp.]